MSQERTVESHFGQCEVLQNESWRCANWNRSVMAIPSSRSKPIDCDHSQSVSLLQGASQQSRPEMPNRIGPLRLASKFSFDNESADSHACSESKNQKD